ncbi:YdeI/OmpD-associated family protein [uncultured Psychroserpens sp.]|uniref:YdeI/OmpD-associated family protein n=1 Tax=uncultured Psychroserpens sp. TaxID=255436 RepID=UPI002628D110|nr:YdeI/OmpD-associated family protein [uncultured Psychroserpens sp.]
MLKSEPFEVTLANKQSIILPEAIAHLFLKNNHKRVKVVATFKEQSINYHGALIPKKNGLCVMYFSNEKQKALGIFMNDYFEIQLFEDQSKYGVDMPEELDAVLMSDHEAYTIFEALTPGRQRSIIYTIKRYKSTQTKVDKAILLTENLKRGVTDPKLWLKQF